MYLLPCSRSGTFLILIFEVFHSFYCSLPNISVTQPIPLSLGFALYCIFYSFLPPPTSFYILPWSSLDFFRWSVIAEVAITYKCQFATNASRLLIQRKPEQMFHHQSRTWLCPPYCFPEQFYISSNNLKKNISFFLLCTSVFGLFVDFL